MDKFTWETQLLQKLKEKMEAMDLEVRTIRQEGVEILRSAYHMKENALVILDMLFFQLNQDAPVLQLYLCVADNMGSEKREALLELLRALNLTIPLGSFGVVDNLHQLYYKHGMLFRANSDLDEAAEQVLTSVELMLVNLQSQYDALVDLAK